MINLLKWFTRIAGLLALLLGLLLSRAGFAAALRIHMTLGMIVVVSLGALAVVSVSARVRIPLAVISFVWAAAILYVGIMQNRWMPGSGHWVIEVFHALLGIGAIGMAEMLAGANGRRRATPA
jgi:hypothetical protein